MSFALSARRQQAERSRCKHDADLIAFVLWHIALQRVFELTF